jgi:serine phosphatase RsbU (regulator of sigma subunit)/anti-sigma regulatory factor (Ser/Thr protein kinase)
VTDGGERGDGELGELRAQASFAPEPTAPSRARSFTRDTLGSWGLPAELIDDAVLLVSELVANGVQHAGTRLEVAARLTGPGLEVQVTDRHPARVLPDEPAPLGDTDKERGRGLLLPMALAAAWGVTYTAAAKTVWFILPAPAAGNAPDAAPGMVSPDVSSPDRPQVGVSQRGLSPLDMPPREFATLDFDDLVRRTVEFARDAVRADAAYALIADEEGELRVRGVVGIAAPEALTVPPGKVVLSGDGEGAMARSQLSVPFLVDGRVTGVLGVGSMADGAFSAADSGRLQQVADRAAMSLERLRLSELERVRRGRVAFLAEASELLSSTLDQRQAIALTAQLLVPRLAAWCAVFLDDQAAISRGDTDLYPPSPIRGGTTPEPPGDDPPYPPGPARWKGKDIGSYPSGDDPPYPPGPARWKGKDIGQAGELRPAYVWHEDESRIDELSDLLDEIAPPGLGRVMTRQATSWSLAVPPGASPEMARMASDAAWCFPLTARGRGLGTVVIGRPRGDRRWPDPVPRESLELAEDLTRRAALALDNARLYERQRTTSQALQHSLLPPELPMIPGIELAAEYEAAGEANEVGGDFYDVFPVDPDADPGPAPGPARWRFAIGDVSGTGPEAAAVTGLARHTLRILAAEGHPITEVVERLNRLILREGTRGRFITLLHGEIEVPAAPQADHPPQPAGGAPPRGYKLSLVCAGHPLPLVLRAGSPEGLSGGTGGDPVPVARPQTLLGVLDDVTFEADETLLYPGDALLSVTDGVTERRDDHGRLLDDDDGLTRLLAECRDLSAWAVASRIQRAVNDFGSEPSSDDMAILVLRVQDSVAR